MLAEPNRPVGNHQLDQYMHCGSYIRRERGRGRENI